jgi:Tol biopolymer transport system component
MVLVAPIALAVLLRSCAAQKGGTAPTKPASPTHNGKIAFVRLDNRVGEFNIFVVEPDGTGLRKLDTKPAQDNFPAWSPNGERLEFEATESLDDFNIDIDIDIYIMNADRSGLKRITNEPTLERMPSWSPDGTKIAFTRISGAGSGRPDVFTMSADGTDLRKLTGKTEGAYSPAFSPEMARGLPL